MVLTSWTIRTDVDDLLHDLTTLLTDALCVMIAGERRTRGPTIETLDQEATAAAFVVRGVALKDTIIAVLTGVIIKIVLILETIIRIASTIVVIAPLLVA